MADYSLVKKEVDTYCRAFRREGLSPLKVSDLYSLFPDEVRDVPAPATMRWPDDDWPDADRKGVYVVFDMDLELLYVGKASHNNCIAGRLGDYFKYTTDGTRRCKLKHEDWTRKPQFVATIAVPAEMSFEAPALEEYLIQTLNPSDNTVGAR